MKELLRNKLIAYLLITFMSVNVFMTGAEIVSAAESSTVKDSVYIYSKKVMGMNLKLNGEKSIVMVPTYQVGMYMSCVVMERNR